MSSDPHVKRTRIDAIVRELQDKAIELAKVISEGQTDFISLYQDLEKQLKKLRIEQQSKNSKKQSNEAPSNQKRDWKPFLKWLKDNEFPNADELKIEYNNEEGHGIIATKDIKKADLVIQVPLKFMMTSKTAIESKLGLLLHNDQLLQSVLSLPLALHLLLEKFTLNSFWGPYISTLPKNPDSPLFADFEQVMRIKGTFTFDELIKMKITHIRQYCHVYFRLEKQLELAIMKRSHFTYDSFTWASATVYARQNRIQLEGRGGAPVPGLALSPVFDLFNHEGLGELTSDYDFEGQTLKMFSVKDFKKGEQIKIFYGPRSNHDFLLYQGFTLPTNPNNMTTVSFQLMAADKYKEKKIEILAKHEIPEKAKYAINKPDLISNEMLEFLRVAWINNDEDMANVELAFKGRAVTLENEERVLTMLELKLQQILGSFPTKLEDDEKEQKSAKSLEFHFLQVLIDEKKLLVEALKVVKDKQKKLQQKVKQKAKKKKQQQGTEHNANENSQKADTKEAPPPASSSSPNPAPSGEQKN